MSKIYLGIITNKYELKNLEELTSVYNEFDGLAVTYHGDKNDEEYKLLDSRKKYGFVECIRYLGHHGHSMNHFLFNPNIKLGDWILLRDSAERINPDFASSIRPFIRMLENNGVNTVYQYSKLLLFKRFPHQSFSQTPHWSFSGAQNKTVLINQQNWFANDKEYCYSVRNETRDNYHFVDAFMRYFLINDSNHNLLGLEHFGNPNELFPILEKQRMDFLLYLEELGIDNTTRSFEYYLRTTYPLPEKMIDFIDSNLIINQFYRYHCWNELGVSPDIKAPIIKIRE